MAEFIRGQHCANLTGRTRAGAYYLCNRLIFSQFIAQGTDALRVFTNVRNPMGDGSEESPAGDYGRGFHGHGRLWIPVLSSCSSSEASPRATLRRQPDRPEIRAVSSHLNVLIR